MVSLGGDGFLGLAPPVALRHERQPRGRDRVALAAHQRGLKLARLCQERLETAQQQVKVLEGDVLKPLAPAEPGADD